VSENGPREGTRDLPRSHPEAGRRAVTADSAAGVAYGSIAKSLRRRRDELAAMVEQGRSPREAAAAYQADHPLEPPVATEEIEAAISTRKRAASRRP
jgi:hypothetical protein